MPILAVAITPSHTRHGSLGSGVGIRYEGEGWLLDNAFIQMISLILTMICVDQAGQIA